MTMSLVTISEESLDTASVARPTNQGANVASAMAVFGFGVSPHRWSNLTSACLDLPISNRTMVWHSYATSSSTPDLHPRPVTRLLSSSSSTTTTTTSIGGHLNTIYEISDRGPAARSRQRRQVILWVWMEAFFQWPTKSHLSVIGMTIRAGMTGSRKEPGLNRRGK